MAETSADSSTRPTYLLRLGLAGLILLAEYLALSFSFDAYTVGKRGGVWLLFRELGSVGPIVVAGVTGLFVLFGVKAGELPARPPKASLRLLAGHVLLGAAFFGVTQLAFGTSEAPAGPATAWMLAWALLGCSMAWCLLVGLVGEWRWLLRTLSRALIAGGTIGALAWLAGSLSTLLWPPLTMATFDTVAALLELLSFELYAEPSIPLLQLEGFAVTVAPVCSGFEGIGLFAVLMLGFFYQFRRNLRFPQALLLLPVGMAAVWVGNAFRIALLMIVGARWDADIALGSFHSKAGWVFFCAITLAVATIARRSRWFSRRDLPDAGSEPSRAEEHNPATALLLPVLTWIGVGLVTSTFSAGHDPLYPVRVLLTGAVLFAFRRSYQSLWRAPTLTAWLAGALVGMAWLVGPEQTDLESAAPGTGAWPQWFVVIWLVFRVLGAVVVVPLCEELAFRGYLARRFDGAEFWEVPFRRLSLLGILGSSLAFGLVHEQWLLGSLTGVAYALVLRRSGRLVDAVVAHAASNLVIAVWVLSTAGWHHW